MPETDSPAQSFVFLTLRAPLLVAAIALSAVALNLRPAFFDNDFEDLFIYRAGAGLGLKGESPYRTEAISALVAGQYPNYTSFIENCGFFLSPVAIVVFAPFAGLPWPAAKLAWSLLCFGGAALAVWKLPAFAADDGRADGWPRLGRLAVACALLWNPTTYISMVVAQTPLFLFTCVVLGEAAYRAGWRRAAGLLWACAFIKPHLALPLLPLAWFLGGWRRAAEVVAWVGGLTLLGCWVSTGSPWLTVDYLEYLDAWHKQVLFNRAELNPQITSWNRLLIATGNPVVELSTKTTLAGYVVWAALVAARVRVASGLTPAPLLAVITIGTLAVAGIVSGTLVGYAICGACGVAQLWTAGSRPTRAWALAAAAAGSLVCCQVLGYEMVLLGLTAPHVLDLIAARRWGAAAVLGSGLMISSITHDAFQTATEIARLPPGVAAAVMATHCSVGTTLVAVAVLVFGWARVTPGTSAPSPASATSP
ncbi:glycosyltransferase family 87 protein [Fimbriiglobus ruber]|uniref:DUF2029 domain-containing protein n=1 Tax=Fimbriiglobus ruber TaxID=1908690 RepID=A0A225E8P2_9BACT|nr:glycosyltransferase family 87 protein [Fimbriiglobus ruber]OWK44985.1 hypothetical protein FRUB_01316 [Fimbriiglobus ruber]